MRAKESFSPSRSVSKAQSPPSRERRYGKTAASQFSSCRETASPSSKSVSLTASSPAYARTNLDPSTLLRAFEPFGVPTSALGCARPEVAVCAARCKRPKQSAPPPPPAPEVDLLGDLLGDTTPTPVGRLQAQASDDLGGMSLLGFSVPTLAAAPAQAAQAVHDPFAVLAAPALARNWAPARLSTNDFGQRWGASPHERRRDVAAPPHASTLSQLAATLAAAGLHAVESIAATNELILAATHAHSGASALWHTKLAGSRLTVTVRAPDPAVADLALQDTLLAVA
mmetsp:Transcript_20382/g.70365  ORF Transcript_20382/g.70365 Transcript_20382/m.70365 type:complete len:284 (+) Transcript_20382:398-1249(+)